MTEQFNQPNFNTKSVMSSANKTFLPLHIIPGTPPFMKQWKRKFYLDEYLGYEKDSYSNTLKAMMYIVLGLVTLPYFAPGALLMVALSARHAHIAWMDRFINRKFGANRTLVLVD
ncbi:MAG: hypothetical protein V1834_04680 [Candidatus Micrarchaeota archaeon]